MSFIDTNILVHAGAAGSPLQQTARDALSRIAATSAPALSRQILREYVAVMTRPQTWRKSLPLTQAVTDAAAFARRFAILEDGLPVWAQLVGPSRRVAFGGRQVHDANIVATMLAHGESLLVTFNGSDFRRFSAVIEIIVP